jgi:hypothetical protein
MQKTRVGEKQLATENTWYETFKAGGESTVQAWKQYQNSRLAELNEYHDSAVIELRSTALIPILLDELESISAYGVNGARVKNKRESKPSEFKGDVGDDEAGEAEDVEFNAGELVASTSRLTKIEKDLGMADYVVNLIERTLHQLDILTILQSKVKSDIRQDPSSFNLPFFQLQSQILGMLIEFHFG